MAVRITVDRFYTDMKEATVGRWLKQEGEPVAEGEPIVELITDKITFELESPGAGPLRRIFVPEKSVVPLGCTLAVLAEAGEELPDIEAENRALIAVREAEVAQEKAQAAGPRLVAGLPGRARGEGVRATPSARRLARERGVDLTAIPTPESGPITEGHVLAFLERQ